MSILTSQPCRVREYAYVNLDTMWDIRLDINIGVDGDMSIRGALANNESRFAKNNLGNIVNGYIV